MPRLKDGSWLPHFISVDTGQGAALKPLLDSGFLKKGTVTRVYYPDDRENTNKRVTEYDLFVTERNGRGNLCINPYYKCTVLDLFGGMGDVHRWTLRPSTDLTPLDPADQDGSQVLVLCVHGDRQNAYIVGATKHRLGPADSRADGHHYDFEFNGWRMAVNDDGECTMTYKSKTDVLGVPADPASGGSFVKFEKDGSIVINDDKNCRLRLDKPTADITIETNGRDVVIRAKRDQNTEVGGDQNTAIEGDLNTKVGGKTTIDSGDTAKVKAPLVELTNGSTSANDGAITGQSVDPFTGVPHIDFSGVVRAKK